MSSENNNHQEADMDNGPCAEPAPPDGQEADAEDKPRTEPGPQDKYELEDFLAVAIETFAEEECILQPRVHTFARAGLLTNDTGLVLRFGDVEFQVRIVRTG